MYKISAATKVIFINSIKLGFFGTVFNKIIVKRVFRDALHWSS